MPWAGKVIWSVVLGTTAFVLGVAAGNDEPPPPPKPVIKEVPKYIEHERTIEKKVVPESCREAIRAAQDVQAATNKYEDAVGRLPKLIDDSYQAIYNKDLKQLNDLKIQQIKLESDSVAALLDIREAQERMAKLQPKCDKATR